MTKTSAARLALVESADASHRLEEYHLDDETVLDPIDAPHPSDTFLLAIGINGHSRWSLGDESLVLPPDTLAVFSATPAPSVVRQDSETVRFLLWRYRTEAVRSARLALGQPRPSPRSS